MTDALLLARSDLEAALDFPAVIEALEQAFHAERRGEWDTPKRIAARTAAGSLLAMPSGGGSPEALGAKLVSTFPGNTSRALPSVSGLYALFDPSTGIPTAIMDGGYLTLVRTAAVSALATRLLARPEARTLGILGSGAQGEFHVRLIASVRPIDKVVIWGRSPSRAEALVARLRAQRELGQVTSWAAATDPSQAARCDVVVTATAATEPILEGRWLSPGAHVTPIGAHTSATRELDTEAVVRASILAVETGDTLLEAGDFQLAEAEAGDVISRVATLGSLLDPARPSAPPREARTISIFKSCGVAFEDLAVASLAVTRARAMGLGSAFPFSP